MLSDTDLSIIKCLSLDPRSPVVKIAEELALPESTVHHRLKRIIESGLIEFTAIVDPLQFGFDTWVIIELQVELSLLQVVGEKLAALPQVYFVGLTTGGYDILAGAVFKSTDELAEFIIGPIAKIRGIVRISTSTVLKALKRTSAFGVLGTPHLGDLPTARPRHRKRGSGQKNPRLSLGPVLN